MLLILTFFLATDDLLLSSSTLFLDARRPFLAGDAVNRNRCLKSGFVAIPIQNAVGPVCGLSDPHDRHRDLLALVPALVKAL